MITDTRTLNKLCEDYFTQGCLAHVLDYFNNERTFPNITRNEMIAIVSTALDSENLDMVYTAISCVRKMTPKERKPLEAKLTALAKHSDRWIRIEALGALNDHNTRREKVHGEYFIRLPDLGAMVPTARVARAVR